MEKINITLKEFWWSWSAVTENGSEVVFLDKLPVIYCGRKGVLRFVKDQGSTVLGHGMGSAVLSTLYFVDRETLDFIEMRDGNKLIALLD